MILLKLEIPDPGKGLCCSFVIFLFAAANSWPYISVRSVLAPGRAGRSLVTSGSSGPQAQAEEEEAVGPVSSGEVHSVQS